MLEPKHGIGQDEGDSAEGEEIDGISLPVCFFVGFDAEKTVEEAFEGF
jgi:hypothetical protein